MLSPRTWSWLIPAAIVIAGVTSSLAFVWFVLPSLAPFFVLKHSPWLEPCLRAEIALTGSHAGTYANILPFSSDFLTACDRIGDVDRPARELSRNRGQAVRAEAVMLITDRLRAESSHENFTALTAATRDRSPAIREAALAGLLDFWEPGERTVAALDAVVRGLRDEVVAVRKKAVSGICDAPYDEPRVFEALALAACDPEDAIRAVALDQAVDMAVTDGCMRRYLASVARDPSSRSSISKAEQPTLSPRNRSVLIGVIARFLEDPRAEIRRRAADGLGNLPDGEACRPLLAALSDRDATVRSKAAESLAFGLGSYCKVHDVEEARSTTTAECLDAAVAVPLLVRALEDDDPATRTSATDALFYLDCEEGAAANAGTLDDASSDVRAAAAWALVDSRFLPRFRARVEAGLSDNAAEVRQACVKALDKFADAEARVSIGRLREDPDESVRKAVAAAIGDDGGNPQR